MRPEAFTWLRFVAYVKLRAWAAVPALAIIWGLAPLEVDGKWILTLIVLLLLGVVHVIEYLVLERREISAASSREARDDDSPRRQHRSRETSG
ncbi:hypothetical protein [Microbacterium xanthum]|uniref:hypothetical protein n=1 Tax=Microbacterium xanthum TaxID=3079794 RepID=UPI002AD4A4FA|nr:hypothetical protein [Microbacterium sp. KSW-48]MDZ8171972.1 hypothetical protein [Microbacterium sp. KSW-48]